MKICFIVWEKFGIGGVSRALTQTLNALTDRHDVYVYCQRKAPLVNSYGLNLDSIRFFHDEMSLYEKIRRSFADLFVTKTSLFSSNLGSRVYAHLKYTRSYKNKMIKNILRENYDIVIFGTGFESSLFLSLIKPEIPDKTKIISWSHACYDDYFQSKGPHFSRYFRHAVANYFHRFDDIVVLSDYDRDRFSSEHNLKTRRIYNANPLSSSKRASLNSKTFVYVGALSRQKGADLVIDAFVKFCNKNTDWRLHIYGEGALASYIAEKAELNGIREKLVMHGNVVDMEEEYVKHTILIFPSRFEGFGMVQVEAMSCGLPLIASDIPICRELMNESKAGLLFDNGDSDSLCSVMLKLSKTELSIMSQNGIQFSKRFSKEIIHEQWEEMFRSLQP